MSDEVIDFSLFKKSVFYKFSTMSMYYFWYKNYFLKDDIKSNVKGSD